MVNSPLTNAARLGRQSWSGLQTCPGRVARALAWPSQKHNIAFYPTWTLPLLKDTPCPIGEQKMRLVVSAPRTTRTEVGAGRFGCLGGNLPLDVRSAGRGRVPSFEWAAYLRRIRSPPSVLPFSCLMEWNALSSPHATRIFFAGGSLSALGFAALGAPFAAAIIYPLCPPSCSQRAAACHASGRLGP